MENTFYDSFTDDTSSLPFWKKLASYGLHRPSNKCGVIRRSAETMMEGKKLGKGL